MKNIGVNDLLNRLRSYFTESHFSRKYINDEPPLRAELFNSDQLNQHGRYLARSHKTEWGKTTDRLLKQLARNEKILLEVRDLLVDAIKEKRLITPAGEWFLDNFYLIEDNIHTGKKHLPKGYSESLPYLTNSSPAGLPRVYDIALEIISHSDGRIDLESLKTFVTAYQAETTLSIGELWAIPIMLRLALIENLRRIAARVAIDRVNQNLADYWARQMVETAEKDPKSLILVIADMARSGPPMESSFVAEMIRQLMWKGSGLTLPVTWMEQRLSEMGLTRNELIDLENQKQAADQVSISNSLGSLRSLGSIEWKDFVEDMSLVEATLRTEHSGVYALMDFATRDHYRHVIESISKNSGRPEHEIALIVAGLANATLQHDADERMAHVGYYLVGDGLPQAAKLAEQKLPLRDRFEQKIKKYPLLSYAGSITLIAIAVSLLMIANAYTPVISTWVWILAGVLSLIAASQLATAVINWWATQLLRPDMLPRMDYSKGIPEANTTMVVVPTMLMNVKQAGGLIESLEVRFLANRDEHLHYALLTDFPDAQAETLPTDARILEFASKKIKALNLKYPSKSDKFFLFHRPRKWNEDDKVWMGYERKRGKLAALNALLRGHGAAYFSCITGNLAGVPEVKYVITLDTDTQFPHEAGWKMVATMAHPLNKPYYDAQKNRVTKGYSILQPRISVSLSREGNSRYSLMNSNEPGIDPYTRLTSDVYQDLFEEGSFIGKGIYDLDAFEQSLSDRFPENRILSHDLLEGCYARAGLLSDVQLYEEYPLHYSNDVSRRHRWTRGDWQIAYWALPFAPGMDRKLHRNPVSALSRWKIFDNLRRSLVPFALTALLLMSWVFMPDPAFWTTAIALLLLLPPVIAFAWNLFHKSSEYSVRQHVISTIMSMRDDFLRTAFIFICMPYEAYYSLDAIFRTGWRMIVSHKKLLEWNPASNQERSNDKTLANAYRTMWFNPFMAAAMFVCLIKLSPTALAIALPVLLMWALAPLAAWWLSRPIVSSEEKLTQKQAGYLRHIARKTWAFFESFVTAEENWLPPDNYQEHPNKVVAHRTSPTNIGMSMLANLAAYDFGYIPGGRLVERTMNTIATLQKMERYEGHLYNWYDTQSLAPLHPRYVSTVDSGNMAGHLLTLRQGLMALPAERFQLQRLFTGLLDTINILAAELPGDGTLQQMKANVVLATDTLPFTTAKAMQHAATALQYATTVAAATKTGAVNEGQWWAGALLQQCKDISDELNILYPWKVIAIPVPDSFKELVNKADNTATLNELAGLDTVVAAALQAAPADGMNAAWISAFKQNVAAAAVNAKERIAAISYLEQQCCEFADLHYDFLYDKSKHLLAIGYNAEEHKRDGSFYDLLASESNLTTFVGIAQGKLPQESWFSLGRSLTYGGGDPILLSWSGSMFEYLMPLLVMPEYENTLLHQTHKNVVSKQIKFGEDNNVPWGVSESGYNLVDANLNYQYRAFGVPGTGLKRGLAEDLVVAPYASALGLMVSPVEACTNMQRLSADGIEGKYGLYEAIDYTPTRLPRGQTRAVIQSFMAHHQGMSLLAIAYALLEQPMQKRFEADLQFRSAMLLLQERVPKSVAFYTYSAETEIESTVQDNTEVRVITTPHTPVPEIQLLSNGKYHVLITNAGGGYSRWKDIAVTRWREDATCDNWGSFCYIRDLDSGNFWSNTYQPTLKMPKSYEVSFTQSKVDFRRRDGHIDTHTEIVVSSEDNIEMRRVHITNTSRWRRNLDVTTYAETVLSPAAADVAHPAFSKLFIQTEIVRSRNAIISTRRPRSASEQAPWMFHMMAVHGAAGKEVSYETDRMKFTGRGNTPASPACMQGTGPLSDSEGSVLDPIASIRHKIVLEPGETVIIDMLTGVSENREGCMGLIEKYQEKHHKDRIFELAWTHSQVVLRQINAIEADAQLFAQLASSIVFTTPSLRADAAVIVKNRRGQSGLWGYSISGDLPIVLLKIEDQANIDLVKQMVQAHTYWRLKGLAVDLVIWNEDHGGYRQDLQNQILGLIMAGAGAELTDHPGGIYVRAADQISEEDNVLFQTVARIIISDKKGTLAEQINRKNAPKAIIPAFAPTQPHVPVAAYVSMPDDLVFYNGTGGYTPDHKEYLIRTTRDKWTPVPWANVISNPDFGCVMSESGQSYTWIENAHEFRLTPWENDPVSDKSGEVFYLRDEETGHFWSPTPLPVCGRSSYITHHGFGYSIFKHNEEGILSELCVHVDIKDSVKFFVIRLKNESGRQRHLSATGYIEWVLGDLKLKTGMHIGTEADPATGAILARNNYNTEFTDRIAFFDTDEQIKTITGDRNEFLGRNGTLQNPAAMHNSRLSGKVGVALDPCSAIQTAFILPEGQEKTIIFRLGAGTGTDNVKALIQQYKGSEAAYTSLHKVKKYWADKTSITTIATPDKAFDVLASGWLIYQTIASRLWARSGYYQSGGAYGFRDQLQDVMAIMHVEPELARRQILQCASRQFKEGDVQHWWHPPTGRGVRTRCSDDMLWLPFVVEKYVNKTGDTDILKEVTHFLEGRQLNPGEESYYDMPGQSADTATLYEHCVRAIKHSLRYGTHGLPLMGSGDWNDGMDMVGIHGKGESIWLGFFLYSVLTQFAQVTELWRDPEFAATCSTHAKDLQANLEKNGWDGGWYRRAYFDDGTPLGSAENEDCQIDSISQSWAILSGAGSKEHTATGLAAADKRLVNTSKMLIQLLDPPFDHGSLNPGYIKGYVPGIRENGGQYTHAAVWMIMAQAASGNSKRAWELMDMVNPINHARTEREVILYKAEPYVMAADVYSIAENSGRGGWTWYTGSAGWMLQLMTERLLGFRLEGNKLTMAPCIPAEWPGYKIAYRHGETTYNIEISRSPDAAEDMKVMLDGVLQDESYILLLNDGTPHAIDITLGKGYSNVGRA